MKLTPKFKIGRSRNSNKNEEIRIKKLISETLNDVLPNLLKNLVNVSTKTDSSDNSVTKPQELPSNIEVNSFKFYEIKPDSFSGYNSIKKILKDQLNIKTTIEDMTGKIKSNSVKNIKENSLLSKEEIKMFAKVYGLNIILLYEDMKVIPKHYFYGGTNTNVSFLRNGNGYYNLLYLKENCTYNEELFMGGTIKFEDNITVQEYNLELFYAQNPFPNPELMDYPDIYKAGSEPENSDDRDDINSDISDVGFSTVNPKRQSLADDNKDHQATSSLNNPDKVNLFNYKSYDSTGLTTYHDNDDEPIKFPKRPNERRSSGVHNPMTPNPLKITRKKSIFKNPDYSSSDESSSSSSSSSSDESLPYSSKSKKKKSKTKDFMKDIITLLVKDKTEKGPKGLVIRKEFNPMEHNLMLNMPKSGKYLTMPTISLWLDKIKEFKVNPSNECLDFKLVSCISLDVKQFIVNQNFTRDASNTWIHKTTCPKKAADVVNLTDEELTEALIYAAAPNNLNDAIAILQMVKIFLDEKDVDEFLNKDINIFTFPKYVSIVINYMYRYASLYEKMILYAKDKSTIPVGYHNTNAAHGTLKIYGAINILMEQLAKVNPFIVNLFNHLDIRIQKSLKSNLYSGKDKEINPLERFVKYIHGRLVEVSILFSNTVDVLRMGRKPEIEKNKSVLSVLQRNGLIEVEPYDAETSDSFLLNTQVDNKNKASSSNGSKLYEPPRRMDPRKTSVNKKQLPCISLSRCADPTTCPYSHDPVVYDKFIQEIQGYVKMLKEQGNKHVLSVIEQALNTLQEGGNSELLGIPSETLLHFMEITQQLSPAYIETQIIKEDDEFDDDVEGRHL
jgi:hypothetical protein